MFGFTPLGSRAFGELPSALVPAPVGPGDDDFPIAPEPYDLPNRMPRRQVKLIPQPVPDKIKDRKKRWQRALALSGFDLAKAVVWMNREKE